MIIFIIEWVAIEIGIKTIFFFFFLQVICKELNGAAESEGIRRGNERGKIISGQFWHLSSTNEKPQNIKMTVGRRGFHCVNHEGWGRIIIFDIFLHELLPIGPEIGWRYLLFIVILDSVSLVLHLFREIFAFVFLYIFAINGILLTCGTLIAVRLKLISNSLFIYLIMLALLLVQCTL